MGMNDAKVIAAAKKLIEERFKFSDSGHYFLKNSFNEEYILNLCGDLHRALVDAGYMPEPGRQEDLINYQER